MTLDKLLARLAELSSGLMYSSESDHPFEVVHITIGEPDIPLTPESVRAVLSLPAHAPVQQLTLDRALGRHTMLVDPMDAAAQALRPRYEALRNFLERELIGATAFRVGRAPVITVLLLARVPGDGLVGYRTTATET